MAEPQVPLSGPPSPDQFPERGAAFCQAPVADPVGPLAVYRREADVLGAAGFGAVYFVIGIAILGRWPGALRLAVVLPAIGGLLGVHRFFCLHTNPFGVWRVALDLIILPPAVTLLARPRAEPAGAPSGSPASL